MRFSLLLVLVSVSVLFSPYMCLDDNKLVKVHVAQWPAYGKELLILLTVCSLCIMSILILVIFHFGFEGETLPVLIAPVPCHCLPFYFCCRTHSVCWRWDWSSFGCCLVHRGSTVDLLFTSDFQWWCLVDQGSPSVTQQVVSVGSSSLLLHSVKT